MQEVEEFEFDEVKELEFYVERVLKITPWLKRTAWAPTTSMMIPSVLSSADDLIDCLEAFYQRTRCTEALYLKELVIYMRLNFKRI